MSNEFSVCHVFIPTLFFISSLCVRVCKCLFFVDSFVRFHFATQYILMLLSDFCYICNILSFSLSICLSLHAFYKFHSILCRWQNAVFGIRRKISMNILNARKHGNVRKGSLINQPTNQPTTCHIHIKSTHDCTKSMLLNVLTLRSICNFSFYDYIHIHKSMIWVCNSNFSNYL